MHKSKLKIIIDKLIFKIENNCMSQIVANILFYSNFENEKVKL